MGWERPWQDVIRGSTSEPCCTKLWFCVRDLIRAAYLLWHPKYYWSRVLYRQVSHWRKRTRRCIWWRILMNLACTQPPKDTLIWWSYPSHMTHHHNLVHGEKYTKMSVKSNAAVTGSYAALMHDYHAMVNVRNPSVGIHSRDRRHQTRIPPSATLVPQTPDWSCSYIRAEDLVYQAPKDWDVSYGLETLIEKFMSLMYPWMLLKRIPVRLYHHTLSPTSFVPSCVESGQLCTMPRAAVFFPHASKFRRSVRSRPTFRVNNRHYFFGDHVNKHVVSRLPERTTNGDGGKTIGTRLNDAESLDKAAMEDGVMISRHRRKHIFFDSMANRHKLNLLLMN